MTVSYRLQYNIISMKRTAAYLFALFLLFTVSTAKADDIATLRSFLDNETDEQAALHSVYMACLNLTRTGTEEAVPLLTQLLDDERFSTVARTALVNIQGKGAAPLQQVQMQDAAMLALILQDNAPGLPLLVEALKEESSIPFRMTLRAVLELKSPETFQVVLNNMGGLPIEQQAALVRNLGARKESRNNPFAAQRLIDLHGPLELRLAAIEAVGEIGSFNVLETLFQIMSRRSPDGEHVQLAGAAIASLKRFSGEEFEKEIIALLDHGASSIVIDVLNVIEERRISAASDAIKTTIETWKGYGGVRPPAYRTFALSSPATSEDIRFMLGQLAIKPPFINRAEQIAAQEALLTLSRKTAEREEAVELFVEELKQADAQRGDFYLDCLFALGGEKAAQALATVAMGTNDTLTDKATQLLGRWTTPEVAPFLIEIAEKHPDERYRSRTLRGYLRVIRQMGLPVEQKVEMAEKAFAVAQTDADKEQAKEVLERFQAMVKGTPIFDGKTFDGWEFRGNEEWFRIEDGAIVGGTFDRVIPRNEFIVSAKEYGDFTLRIECKALGRGCNGGVQFRSFRTPADSRNPNEMIGYQADMTETTNYWGAIYDESRRNRFIAEPSKELIERIFRPNDWNEYVIVCKGNNVKVFLNGELTVDYTEADADIPQRGFIGLQIHSGPPSETWYRNIRVEEGV